MTTRDVSMSLDLMEVRKQQRRVCALLQGDADNSVLPLSYRQKKVLWSSNDASKGKKRPERNWVTGVTTSPLAETTFSNNFETFRNDADKNRIFQTAHRCDNEKPTTRLPSIESHRTFSRRSSSTGREVDCERVVHYLENSNVAGKSKRISRDSTRKYEIKESNNSDENADIASMSKPVKVKYKHQKVNPSIEELWRRYREERCLERGQVSKTIVTDISDKTKRIDYSNLSSIDSISPLRRQLAETDNNSQTLNSDRVISSNIVGDNALSDPTKIIDCMAAAVSTPEKDGHVGHRLYLGLEDLDENLSKEEIKNCLTKNNTCAAQSSPVVSSDVDTFVNNPNRLPDIRVYWQPQVTFEPEVRKWNPNIGETTRAFVFSYFDRLPPLDRSRDSEDADDRKKLQSSYQTKSKTKRK